MSYLHKYIYPYVKKTNSMTKKFFLYYLPIWFTSNTLDTELSYTHFSTVPFFFSVVFSNF